MTAVIRNNAGEDRFIPLAGRVVADGDTFELDDEEFDQYEFGDDFKVIEEPTSSKSKPKAAADKKKES